MPGMYAINTVNGLAMAGQLGYPLAAAQGAYGQPRTVGEYLEMATLSSLSAEKFNSAIKNLNLANCHSYLLT